MTLPSPPVAGVWWAHTLDRSMTLSPLHRSWCVVSAYTWLTLWLSLFSTCSWCVVSAYTWLSLWLSLLSTCSWCVVSAYTWLSLWLSLFSTCSWCVVSAYTWLSLWLSLSPPVAGVWWAHTLDCLYDSLSSPPVAGVWWAHTLDLSLWLSLFSACSWLCGEHTSAVVLSQPLHHPSGGWGETPPPRWL